MAVGLAVTKWRLLGSAASLPAFEGVVTALLTAMSLLAFLGLRYPVRMLPLLMFESLWKVIWLGVVGIPYLLAGDMNAQGPDSLQRLSGRRHPRGHAVGLRLEALCQSAR